MKQLTKPNKLKFLSTPSGWRATKIPAHLQCPARISIHALRVEGDVQSITPPRRSRIFLSTPSGWRATPLEVNSKFKCVISIHALRVEGDCHLPLLQGGNRDFYPRPPGGGRRIGDTYKAYMAIFLSTPSGWRATDKIIDINVNAQFLSTPSGWRATSKVSSMVENCLISIHALRVEGDHVACFGKPCPVISIHALRVEGDLFFQEYDMTAVKFLSTPSGWRATFVLSVMQIFLKLFLSTPSGWRATLVPRADRRRRRHFYPRPPGGGRRNHRLRGVRRAMISIHALRVEGDVDFVYQLEIPIISIHALRVEGDSKNGQSFCLLLRKREKNLPL